MQFTKEQLAEMPEEIRESALAVMKAEATADAPAENIENPVAEEAPAPEVDKPEHVEEPAQEEPVQEDSTDEVAQLRSELETLRQENVKLKSKTQVVEGKLKAEGPRYAEQIRQLKAELETLKANQQPASKADSGPVVALEDDLKAHGIWEQAKGYDEDAQRTFLEIAKKTGERSKTVAEEAARKILEPVVQQANEARHASFETKVMADPDCQKFDADPEFDAWLERMHFGRAFATAVAEQDVQGTLSYYRLYGQIAAPQPAGEPTPRPKPKSIASQLTVESKTVAPVKEAKKAPTKEDLDRRLQELYNGNLSAAEQAKLKTDVDEYNKSLRAAA